MNWDNAKTWADAANENKQPDWAEPNWSWDCGLKLDFDGGILRVSSRFYQVREDVFDGSVSFYIGDAELFNREFSSKHIDYLKKEVEEYVKAVTENIKQLCITNLDAFVRVR